MAAAGVMRAILPVFHPATMPGVAVTWQSRQASLSSLKGPFGDGNAIAEKNRIPRKTNPAKKIRLPALGFP